MPLAEHLHQPRPPEQLSGPIGSRAAEALQHAGERHQRKTDWQEEAIKQGEPADVPPQEPERGPVIQVLGNQLAEGEDERRDEQRCDDLDRHSLGQTRLDRGNSDGDREQVVRDVVADERSHHEIRRVLAEPEDAFGDRVAGLRIDAHSQIARTVEACFGPAEEGSQPQAEDEQREGPQVRQHAAHADASGAGCARVSMARSRPRFETSITRMRKSCQVHSSPTAGKCSSFSWSKPASVTRASASAS